MRSLRGNFREVLAVPEGGVVTCERAQRREGREREAAGRWGSGGAPLLGAQGAPAPLA